ncbi:LamG domain-containing protein [Streptomyces sp. WAC07061]|uniref:LamG domain-containing protein n=1 Tax=Streptomyces sp. WAC07061 TaxID=2487410 RepID=UPI000F780F9F|nr:LamG domain-containing protein [Streptomyces sp. WAC07061]RSS61729.1 LamG domain-containing protein [Streptomyces sp. WAC07061]
MVSDGRYILVFRQSVDAWHADMVHRTTGNTLSGDAARTDYATAGGAKVPAADASLLCDRYALVGSQLKPVVEVRYQRSRSKFTQAAGGIDTLGTRDMDGKQFYEPTTRLSFLPRLTAGGFAVMLLPTEVEGVSRWQLFVNNAAEKRIESFNCERTADGLFDTVGTQLYTSPDPRFRKSVLEREPGTDPNTGRPLVPVPATTDRAGTALRFTAGVQSEVLLGTDALPAPGAGATFEAWVRPTAPRGTVMASRDDSGSAFHFGLDSLSRPFAASVNSSWDITGQHAVTTGVFVHLALVVDGKQVVLYVDGVECARGTAPTGPVPAAAQYLGRHTVWHADSAFVGDIDEVRIWNRARTPAELADRGRRLLGTEPDLVTYLRLDEGAGNLAANLVDRRRDTALKGTTWVGSDAPVGDGPGLSRDLFAIKGREVVGALTAALYFQQEQQPSGYGAVTAEKRQARILLACATSGPPPQGGTAGRNYLCTLDLALDRGGRLAALPRELALDPIGKPEPTKDLDRLAAADARVSAARAQLGADRKLAGDLQPTLEYAASIRDMGYRRQQYNQLVTIEVPKMQAAQARLGQDEAQVKIAEAELAALSGGMQGAAEAVLPMPQVAIDRAGLTAYGALLTFAWTNRAPSLLDSANGDVVLYYTGTDGEFFSVYYPTTVSRATRRLTAGTGALSLIARDPAARLADFAATVTAGGTAGTCTVTVTAGTTVERFPDVPRAAADFARVLGGRRIDGALLGRISAAQDAVLELAEPLAQGLPAGAAVAVGGRLRTVAATAATGSTKITLTVGGLAGTGGQDLRRALYDYAKATCTVPGVSLAAGSRIVGVSTAGVAADQQVADGTAADDAQPLLPRWRGDAPGRALTFGRSGQRLTLPQDRWPKISPDADLTVEAWVNPASVEDFSRIWHANTGAVPYSLGLEVARELSSKGGAGWIDIAREIPLNGRDFTIEFWGRRDPGNSLYPFAHGVGVLHGMEFSIHHTNEARFGWNTTSGRQDFLSGGQADGDWHCWSAVYEAVTRRRTLYRDGVQVAQDTAQTPYEGIGVSRLAFGPGSHDEIRVWGRARSADEIAAMAKRRPTGRERDLLAYWTFTDGVTADRTGHGYDGTPGGPVTTDPSAPWSFKVVAGVGSQRAHSQAAFPLADWSHVAATFRQDWALALDGTGYVDAGGPEGLDLADDLTIEAFLKVDAFGSPQGLVGKGALETGVDDAVPYAFHLTTDGQLAFTFEAGDGRSGSRQTYTSGTTVPLGRFTKVAVTRSAEDKDGQVRIRFYIDGKAHKTDPDIYKGAKPVGNDANCEIGRFRVRSTAFGLRGTLAQVRIWNTVRAADQIGTPIAADAKGLVAWWRFPERIGTVTADACGSYPAQLRGATRVRTPDPEGNRIVLYHNGVPSTAVPVPAHHGMFADFGLEQVTVGAMQRSDGTWDDLLDGGLDELRVWRTCRTQEQILDNMFTRLRSKQEDLLAYYPIDPDSAKAGATVLDAGPAGCHLAPSATAPGVGISHAPISNDTAEVRSALTGTRNVFQSHISATPHAGEYADLQTDSQGLRFGVMKRAYSSVRDGSWSLTTGYKVGDLITTWVGQAQFAPQLVGYLEGAPPVPSENLVKGTADDFKDAASVKFVQANTVTNTLAAESKNSFDASAKFFINASYSDDTYIVSAPLGAGTAKRASSNEMNLGISGEVKESKGWSNETQVTQGATTTRTSEVALTGHWEPDDAKKQVNPTAGRRWVPANTGFAFVQSDTADQYALRLKHNGALVAYRMVPNPAIPTDWNIIPFPINPQYTKQGTLDGLVGYAADPATGALQPFPDPDFPRAGTGRAFSYHRPEEAYALKRRIQREEQQLQGFYETANPDPKSPDPIASAADRVLKGMMGGTGSTGLTSAATGDAASARAARKSAAKRNIANTYVWTAAGGLFSEVTGTTDQVVQTTAGEYSLSGSSTYSNDYGFEFGGVGFKTGFEISLGGGYSLTRRKTKDSQRTFSLEVTAKPSGNLQKHDAGNPVFDAKNQPVLVPGRVDAYRFMTFYLDTSSDNFEDFYGKVVDPAWLETGTSAHARELARAQQSDRKPPCWRVLHRVTYVSRVLDTTSPSAPGYAKALGALGLTSDHQLFLKLDPYLTGATGRLADLTAATAATLSTNFPTLVPYTATITERLAAYHQLTGTRPGAATTTPARASLTLPGPTSPRGTNVTVGYTVPPEQVGPKNWVALLPAGAAVNAGSSGWTYTPNATGKVTIPGTDSVPAGRYQLWLLANDAYGILAGPYDLTIA